MKTITARFSPVCLRLFGLAAVLLIAASPQAPAQQAIGGLRIERAGHTATRLPSGKVLVVGGENANGGVRDSEIFDPVARTFTPATGLLTARADHTAMRLPDGRLFVIGGRSSGQLLNSTEIYDPEAGVFSSGPGLNRARAGHTATLLPDGRVVVVGGDADGSIEVFDPQAGAFSLLEARLAVPRRSHAAALLQSGEILIAGGNASNGAALDSAELLDATLTFTSITPSMHVARSRPALRMLPDGKVQVIGGDPEATMELFNPDGGYFTSLAHPAANPALLSAALRTQTRAAVLGHPLPMKLQGTGDITATADDVIARSSYSLTEIPELNQALAAGGTTTSGKLKTDAALFASSAATVTTDKTDYVPRDTVIITGTGWQPGEMVNLNIHRDTNTPPDTVLTATADALGNIQNSDYVVQDYDLGVTFLLTATGQTSGYTAQTTFTDSRTINSVTLNGGSTVNVAPSASITAVVNVTTDNSGGNQNWRSTGWRISTTAPGTVTCVDHPNHDGSGTYSETFTITAPVAAGTYNAYFIAYSNDTCTNQPSNTLTLTNGVIVNGPPTVNTIALTPEPSNEGSSVSLSAAFTDPNALDTFSCSINWGDGSPVATGTVSGLTCTGAHTYTDNNTPASTPFTVTVTITDDHAGVGSKTASHLVNNVAPTVVINGAPASSPEGTAISLTSTVTDPSTADAAAGFTYAWTVTKNGNPFASGAAASINIAPDDNATYVVTFTATDKDGGVGIDTKTIMVFNVPPTATIVGAPATSPEGMAISLTSTVTDPSTVDTAAGFTYAWSVTKDGNPYGAPGTLSTYSFTPDDNGTYIVTFSAKDKDSGIGTDTKTITVTNVAPAIANDDLSLTATTINENDSVTLSGHFTDPGTLDTHVVTISWGDGSSDTTLNLAAGVLTFSTSHQYLDDNPTGTSSDVNAIGVTVTDKDSDSGSASKNITVNNVAPTITSGNLSLSATSVNEGGSVTLTGSFTDPGTQDTHKVTINWGDGSVNTTLDLAAGVLTFSATHTYLDDNLTGTPSDTNTISVTVADDDTGSSSASTSITVNNVAPTVDTITLTPEPSNEGSSVSLSAAFTDPGTLDTFTCSINWGDGSPATGTVSGHTCTGAHTYTDNNTPASTPFTVTVTITDDDTGVGSKTASHLVNNVAPTAVINGAPASSPEGTAISLTGTVTDPSTADATAGFTYAWSVTKNGNPFASGTLTGFSFTPDDNGTYVVSLTATDKDGGTGTAPPKTITVTNVAPTATLLNGGPINEGSSAAITFNSSSDVSSADTAATFHYAYSCTNGDLSAVTYASTVGSSASTSCTFANNGSYTVKGRIIDKDNGFSEYTTTVVVNNVAPSIISVTGPTDPQPAPYTNTGNPIIVNFTDPGSLDTHTCTFSWDDPTPDITVNANAPNLGSGSCSATHTFSAAGVYTVGVTVTDKDGGTASSVFQFVVVYDPGAGFVTGGGWILSPTGAYVANPSLTGKANFGFVAKYQKGANVPTGNTEFQFQTAGFNFHSETYQWLVVAGAKAQYKGTGTVNGTGGYGFLLTATDGDISGNKPDQFRIKVWDVVTNDVVYDNAPGSDDINTSAQTTLGGGSIVIHK